MKYLLLSCFAAVSLISLAACSSDSDHPSTTSTTDQSASMQTDSKDMHPVHH